METERILSDLIRFYEKCSFSCAKTLEKCDFGGLKKSAKNKKDRFNRIEKFHIRASCFAKSGKFQKSETEISKNA